MDINDAPNNTENDCPVCFGEMGNPAPICANGHKVCDTCRPHVYRGNPDWNRRGVCPMCRGRLLGEPQPAPAGSMNAQWDADVRPQPARQPARRGARGEDWERARQVFLESRAAGHIPPDAMFGGIHTRNCGHRGCLRTGGSSGVRFLLFGNTGKRRYRCELHTEN